MNMPKNMLKLLPFLAVGLVGIGISANSASSSGENALAETPDHVAQRTAAIFAKVDELPGLWRQRSRQYLESLKDDELARIYVRRRTSQVSQKHLSGVSLKGLKKDRATIINKMLKSGGPLDREGRTVFRNRYTRFVNELTALGPKAVPAIVLEIKNDRKRTGYGDVSKKAILNMGLSAVEPLIDLLEAKGDYPKLSILSVLSHLAGLHQLAEPRVKEVFLRYIENKSASVRRDALQGLVNLGPDVVGSDKLVTILIQHLEDSYVLQTAIDGLRLYGDERATEALSVIERFDLSRGKSGILSTASEARQAINAILQRAGKPVKEVQREDYSGKNPTYEELCTAAQCPNAAIRCAAISRLNQHEDDRTALFLIERLTQEENPEVVGQIARTLRILMIPPKGSSEPVVSVQVMQKALDTFMSLAESDPPQDLKVKIAAIHGVRGTLYAASLLRVPLRNIDRFKRVVRAGLSSKIPDDRIAFYSGVTSIATVCPETAATWSPQERKQLQEQLSPFLDLPGFDIRLIECLGHTGDKRLTPRLIEFLGHDDEAVRRFAAGALGRIGDSRAVPVLRRLAETDPAQYSNGVYGVRLAANEAIELITNVKPIDADDKIRIKINRNLE